MTNFLLKLVYNLRGGSNPYFRSPKLWYTAQPRQDRRNSTTESEIWISVLYVPYNYVTLPTNRNRLRRELCSFGLLRSEYWYFFPEVSGQPIGPNFMGQESGVFSPEEGTYRLSRKWVKITTNRCIIAQKSTVFVYFASEARNHAHKSATLLDLECPNVFWSTKECPENSFETCNFFLNRLKHKPASYHSKTPSLYPLQKAHKTDIFLRTISSSINSPCYAFAGVL
jgi:hypothetical protein